MASGILPASFPVNSQQHLGQSMKQERPHDFEYTLELLDEEISELHSQIDKAYLCYKNILDQIDDLYLRYYELINARLLLEPDCS